MQRLVGWQREKSELTGVTTATKAGVRGAKCVRRRRPITGDDSTFDDVAHHIRVVDPERHVSRCER